MGLTSLLLDTFVPLLLPEAQKLWDNKKFAGSLKGFNEEGENWHFWLMVLAGWKDHR